MIDHHAILGVEKDATETDLRRAWKCAAFALHPDRGGDPEAFLAAQMAYETLLRRLRAPPRVRPVGTLPERWWLVHGSAWLDLEDLAAWVETGDVPELEGPDLARAIWAARKLWPGWRIRSALRPSLVEGVWVRVRVWWVEPAP